MKRLLLGLALLGLEFLSSSASAQAPNAIPFTGETIFIPSAARTTTTSSAWYYNEKAKGLALVARATAITLTPVVTLTLEIWNPSAGAPITFYSFAAGTILDAVEEHRILINPSGTTAVAAGVTDMLNGFLPAGAIFRITGTASDADSITYSITGWPGY